MEMQFQFLDPNNKRKKPSMPFVLDFNDGETKGEADSPAGLAALIIGPEYADITDEEVAWHARVETMEWHALWLAGLGVCAVVVDGSVREPIFDPFKGQRPPEIELRVDGDWAMVASLHNAGLVTIFEKKGSAVFRGGAAPASCAECRYYEDSKRCAQFDIFLGEETAGCLDGALKPNENGAETGYARVEQIEIAPERVKHARVPAA